MSTMDFMPLFRVLKIFSVLFFSLCFYQIASNYISHQTNKNYEHNKIESIFILNWYATVGTTAAKFIVSVCVCVSLYGGLGSVETNKKWKYFIAHRRNLL